MPFRLHSQLSEQAKWQADGEIQTHRVIPHFIRGRLLISNNFFVAEKWPVP
jgi:hypothetical protein